MDEVQGCQVDHARGDLGRDLEHLGHGQLAQCGHLSMIIQDSSVGAMSPGERRRGVGRVEGRRRRRGCGVVEGEFTHTDLYTL